MSDKKVHCLCDQCKMTVQQCKERGSATSAKKVLDTLEVIINQRLKILNTGDLAHKYTLNALKEKIQELQQERE